MKRAFPQKVKSVTYRTEGKDTFAKYSACKLGLFTQTSPEGNRRACTSAAMIGLAISMGASSLFLPRQGDAALAVEPQTADPTATTALSSSQNAPVLPVAEVAPAPAASQQPGQTSVEQQPVQEGNSLQSPSDNLQVDSTAQPPQEVGAAPVGQQFPELNSQTQSSSVEEGQAVEPAAERVESQGVETAASTQAPPAAALPQWVSEGQIGNGVKEGLKAKEDALKATQEVAINGENQASNRLRDSVAELRSEESANSQLSEPEQPSAAANPTEGITQPKAAADGESKAQATAPQAVAKPSSVILPQQPPTPPSEVAVPALIPGAVAAPQAAAAQARAFSPWQPAAAPSAAVPSVIPGTVPQAAASPTVLQPEPATTPSASALKQAPEALAKPEAAAAEPAIQNLPVPATPPSVSAPEQAAEEAPQQPAAAAPESLTPEVPPKWGSAPDLSSAVVIAPQAADGTGATKVRRYRVNPGDTLGSIAQTYGVSPQTLLDANQLSDPNVIKVGQTLDIPLYQLGSPEMVTAALIPNSRGASSPYSPVRPPEMTVPNVVLRNRAWPADLPSLPLLPGASPPESAGSSAILPPKPDDMELVAQEQQNQLNPTPSGIAAPEPLQSPAALTEEQARPSLDSLRAEIEKLREKYRRQQEENAAASATISAPPQPLPVSAFSRPVAVPAIPQVQQPLSVPVIPQVQQPVSVPVIPPVQQQEAASASEPSAPATPVNPEFTPDRYSQAWKRQIGNQEQQLPALALPSEMAAPAPVAVPVIAKPAPLPVGQQVVATAPLAGPDSYEQPLQPRMVSPQLPPLAPADTYLPKGGAVFNGYIWPAQGEFTSGYGWRWGRMHRGIDIAAAVGTPIVASAPGTVTYAQWNDGGYGNLVEITHPDGTTTLYAHNDRLLVREGQEVDQGQQIAEMGSTGFSTGPHLHFEVHPRGQGAVNPIAYLPR
ncbi:MAG: peptidoglycan DD-metalloendopeptidase family protein [Oscillatoria sp. Prado101]|nr:peptidoglycan DD-metalloendopeptidase family protein [Oscillatoria sp. Prado101]